MIRTVCYTKLTLLFIIMTFRISSLWSADPPVNYDEAKIPPYELPNALVTLAGTPVDSQKAWREVRRPELLALFTTQMYGLPLVKPAAMTFEKPTIDDQAYGGKGIRKSIWVRFDGKSEGPSMEIVLYLPKQASKPVPVFVGMHLFPKADADPRPGGLWQRPESDSTTQVPGERLGSYILERGYGFATLTAEDFAPDADDRYTKGVIGANLPDGQTEPGPDQGRAIAAWAWGLSRALDYLETDRQVDSTRVIAVGHSRMGKTALWAAAQDERFAIAISNNSGCGGAALSRRIFGETVGAINRRFPHWFCTNFRQFNEHENEIPFDQHELIGLIAPRPVYVASAEDDRWADPRGELLAAIAAQPVYRLLGRNVEGLVEAPPINRSVGDFIGYHLRTGKHALTDFDWVQYLDFADRHFGRSSAEN